MKIKIEVPNWTKAVMINYVYYDEDGDGRLTIGCNALAGPTLEEVIVEEDDLK